MNQVKTMFYLSFLLTMPEFVEEKAEQFDSEQQNNVEESTTEPGRVLWAYRFLAFIHRAIYLHLY
jgi:hypothetical protein